MKHFCLRVFFVFVLAVSDAFAGSVLINEIMFHAAPGIPENDGLEWIELYNNDTNAISLNGWRFDKGINFTFTNTTLSAHGYVVVAANLAAFTARNPGVANVVGDWVGALSNNGDELRLVDAEGSTQDDVSYASEGDWGIRQRGPFDLNHYGWQWFCEADGLGKSLELRNPNLPNEHGQNWGTSTVDRGTPGRTNSLLSDNIAPMIIGTTHFPLIPKSTDPVTITATVIDESSNFTVLVFYRLDANPQSNPFTSVQMFDDGLHGDGIAGDGVFGAQLPARPNLSVIEFFIEAVDDHENIRDWPAAAQQLDSTFAQTCNALYQVVDDFGYGGSQPLYQVIMTDIERLELDAIGRNSGGAADSDATMNGTFISMDATATEVRYLTGFRNRGHGSRTHRPNNIRANFRNDDRWKGGVRAINLNTAFPWAQSAGSALFQKAGLVTAFSKGAQVRINGAAALGGVPTFGSYAHNEEVSSEYVAHHFPTDNAGNSYRGIRIDGVAYANLTYLGPSKDSYTGLYFKQNNNSEDDWADLIELTRVLSDSSLTGTQYVAEVRRVLNVENAMLYFAVNTLVDNRETSLANGNGDDYAMYRGVNDTRFLLLPYDMDTIMGQGDTPGSTTAGLFPMLGGPAPGVALQRLMANPEFVPIYFGTLKRMIETTFSAAQLNPLLDRVLGGWVPDATITAMKQFQAGRNAFVLSQIPLNLTVSSPLPLSSGYPRSTVSTASLSGQGNAIDTRFVRVNGTLATWTPVQGSWTISGVPLNPGINRILVQAFGTNATEIARTTIDIWYDNGASTGILDDIGADSVWTPAGGPYVIQTSTVVLPGVTLRILPGTTVYFVPGTSLTINGRLLAEGTETNHIRFTRQPGSANNWGSMDFINSSVESRVSFADFEFAGGTTIGGHNAEVHVNSAVVFFDHLTFSSTPVVEYISFDGSSFIVQNSTFPTYPGPTGPEMLHGVNGIPASGYGIFRDNYFGHTWGFNDTIDFTGGNRPGAVLQVINNVFDGAGDDHLDLDSTDAWIEGNIFMHAHRDPSRTDDARDTSSAISGGIDFAGQFSEWTIINNLFYDVDHACLNKGGAAAGGGRFIFVNNTLVHVAKENGAGLTNDIAAFDFTDDGIPLPDPSYGAGAYVAGNIIWDCPRLTANYNPANHTVIFENNILPVPWIGPGGSNVVIDPHLNLQLITNAITADWRTVKAALTPQPDSPARGTGVGGFDKGGLNPRGLLVYGEPFGTTDSTSATLTVAPGGTFNWGTLVPPYQWGYTHYKWKLDNGPWSAETSITTSPTISLTGLANGSHTVYVVGKNDAPPGYYQDDTFVYPATAGIPAHVTASRTWTVSSGLSRVVINEVLARNTSAVLNGEDFPDVIELYNPGGAAVNLSGMGLTDDPVSKFKFAFPPGTSIAGGGFLVVFGGNPNGAPGLHTGFKLDGDGSSLFLFDAAGAQIDSIAFGKQLPDLSIGRLSDGTWSLTQPTFGSQNLRQPTGDFRTLKINEWLADARTLEQNDFVEIYNPDPLPVNLGGLFLSDAPQGSPNLNPIPALSFMPGSAYQAFIADGKPKNGADHLDFKLSPDQGQIALFSSNLDVIDCIFYGPQATDVSEGRQPNGGPQFAFFDRPTPGAANPGSVGNCTVSNTTLNLLPMTSSWRYNRDGADLGTGWRAPGFDDASWPIGQALLGVEDCGCLPFALNTVFPNYSSSQIIYYFRTTFQVNSSLAGLNLTVSHVLDDGAVIYLDGTALPRVRMPGGTVTATTLPTATVGNAILESFTVGNINLTAGTHSLAVEVHNSANPSSSDIVWGMALDATSSVTNCVQGSVVLNEVMANNSSVTNSDGTITDWVELYNPTASDLDLSDMSLTDTLATPRRWVVPSGVVIPAGAYLVVKFDNTNAPSLTNGPLLNAGFGLDFDGDKVFLFDSPGHGGALLSSITFGIQPEDFSIGRVPNGAGNWVLTLPTPGALNIAVTLGNPSHLKVNEWMASPNSGDDWFELYNPEGQPVSVSLFYLTDDLNLRTQFQIPALSFIGGAVNGFVQFHADNNPSKGATHTNFKLSGGGESIGLFNPAQALVDGITFGPQQQGISEGRFPDGSTNITTFPGTDTPAASNLRPLSDIVINEVLTHTDPPFEDAIELYNPTAASIDVSGWYLSDSKSDPLRFRIPNGTVIASGGFAVFYEYQFNPNLGHPPSFALSSAHGDDVFLFPADAQGNLTGYRTSVKFGAAENPVAFGRYDTSVKTEFTALSVRSFGADNPASLAEFRTGGGLANAYPKVGPIVINEIQYHPQDIISGTTTNDNALDEFIELQNITTTNVPLYHADFPTNKWRLRDAVDFTFPDGFSLPPDGFVLIVNFDPLTNVSQLAAFQTKYSIPGGVPILGPYDGKLDNGGESVELVKPDAPQPLGLSDAGFVPFILVDKVEFKDSAPWPKLADGTGNSLQRRNRLEYGNDPVNWFAGAPTAGATNGVSALAPPVISNLTPSHSIALGVSDTFVVTAGGAGPLSYQWYFNASPIDRATNTSFTLGSVVATNAGTYSVLVGNSVGATSAALRLDVELRPVILQQPQSRVAALGQSVVFTVGVQGSLPLSYRWLKDGSPISGATNPVYRITNIQASDEAIYRVEIFNAHGNVTSDPAALSLSAAPAIVGQPQSTNVFVGASVTFSVVANGSQPLHYQWRFGLNNLPGATSATLTLNNVQQSNAGNYTVLVTNSFDSILSQPANLSVSIPPIVSVRATDSAASEPGSNTGMFTVTRTNGLTLPLTVYFSVSGTATPGADYVALTSPVTFAAGSASTNLLVKVLDDTILEPVETVVLTLANHAEYVILPPTNATVTIADNDNLAPSVTVTNPVAGAIFNAGDNISLGATASDPDGSVAKVEFFYDSINKIGEVLSSPYRFIWTNAVAGNHTITAVATDNLGRTAGSTAVAINVNASPVISLTAPANGALFFTPANITIIANPTDSDGTVASVDFYTGTNLLGTVSTPPFTLTWSNVDIGSYTLSARATDNRGALGFSPDVNITVAVPTPTFGDMFALHGVIGGITNNVTGTNTSYTREAGEPVHAGVITAHSGWLSWTAPADGVCAMDTFGSTFDTVLAIYTNRPASAEAVSNLVPVVSNDDVDDTTLLSRVSFHALGGVTYFIAVDGYGTGTASSGIIGFHLNFVDPFPFITNQPVGLLVNQGSNVTFVVGAVGPPPLRYQWYFGNSLLNAETNTSLLLPTVGTGNQGSYVVVVSNNSGSVTSSPANLTLRVPPTLATPLLAQVVDPGSNVTFSVSASGTPPFTYLWRFNGGTIPGATTATFTKANVQYTNGGIYAVTIGNPAGQFPSQAELYIRPTLTPLPIVSNGLLRLTVSGTPGKRYSIDASTNFTGWASIGGVTNTAVQASFDDVPSSGVNRVYRARLLVP